MAADPTGPFEPAPLALAPPEPAPPEPAPGPPLGSWAGLYLLVLGALALEIALLRLLTLAAR